MKQWITLQQITEDDEELKLYETMLELSEEHGVDINDLMLHNDDYPEIGYYDEASEEYRKAIREFRMSDIRNAKVYIEAVKEKRYYKDGNGWYIHAGSCHYSCLKEPTVERGMEMLRAAIQEYNEEFPESPYEG